MSEWISIQDKSPGRHFVCQVKRANGMESKSYYHRDGMAWLIFYGVKTSRFQDYYTKDFLFDVTHWSPLLDHV